MAKQINTEAKYDLVEETKSFSLLRTNPKLTSNVKLVVESEGDIYLSSIKASRTLTQAEFQKYPISDSGEFSRDVASFYGKLPKDERYRVGREVSDLIVSDNYANQFENMYNYGASFNFTKVYDEQYRIFAPIWLEKKIPENFVIYRIKDVDYEKIYDDNAEGQNYRIMEMLSKATIVKTFDMSIDSRIGTYLNSHINDALMPDSHLSFNFEIEEPTYFNGIDVMTGGFVNKSDYIDDDYIKEDLPEILANNTLTTSFERNGIISANIINLEFLFDDKEADDYNIYRYFGVYADSHLECSFIANEINPKGTITIDPVSVEDEYGVSVDSANIYNYIPSKSDLSVPSLSWVKDRNDDFHHIKNSINYSENEIKTSFSGDTSVFKEFVKTPYNIDVISKDVPLVGFISLEFIKKPTHNDKLFIGNLSEISIERFNLGDFLLIADDTLPIGTISGNRYSCKGNLSQIASALAAAIRNGEIIQYGAKSIKTSVIIDDYAQGRNRNKTIFGIHTGNPRVFLDVSNSKPANDAFEKAYNLVADTSLTNVQFPHGSGITGNLSIGDYKTYTMKGGSSIGQSVIVPSGSMGFISIGDHIKSKNKDVYCRVVEIVKDPYSENYRVIFDKPINFSGDNTLPTYNVYRTRLGRFSAYDFKDFDFDFYDTKNSDISHLNGEIQNHADDKKSFIVSSASSIKTIDNSTSYITEFNGLDVRDFLEVGDYILGEDSIGIDNWIKITKIIYNETYNTTSVYSNDEPIVGVGNTIVPGLEDFFSYKSNVKEEFFTTLYPIISEDDSDKDLTDSSIYSEYDRLSENELKETSINSRVLPTICKFALKNGTNARNLPYILNVNEAFGTNNLSPDISIFSERDPSKLNMEHFHIWNIPTYLREKENIIKIKDYVNPSIGTQQTYDTVSSLFKDTSFDYFSSYLNYTGAELENTNGDIEWVNAQTRKMYTTFEGGNEFNFTSTVFRGLRYVYKERKEFDLDNPVSFKSSSSVEGYKFATVLFYSNNMPNNKANIEVIKNDKFKTITIFIHIQIVANDIDFLDRYNVYSLEDVTVENEIKNSKIRGFLDFGIGSAWGGTSGILLSSSIQSVGDNSPRFFTDMFKIEEEYSYILFEHTGNTYALEIISAVDEKNIIVKGVPQLWETSTGKVIPGQTPITSASASAIPNDIPLVYYQGGKNSWSNVLESIASFGFANDINANENVSYVTILEDGNVDNNKFTIEIEDGTEFIKTSILDVELDEIRPKAFKLNNNKIGKELVAREDGGYFTTLRRMNGKYNPMFNEIVTFTNLFRNNKMIDPTRQLDPALDIDSIQIIEEAKYKRTTEYNTVFSSYLKTGSDYGILKNFFYHKINEKGNSVLKLSKETDKLPLYPLIGEIAIEKRDLNLFKSKYAKDYYIRSLEGGVSENVHGTLSPIEERSFFASTIMKVKDVYNITSYSNTSMNSLRDLDSIRYSEKAKQSAYLYEDSQKIYIDFYIIDSFINELKEDNISAHYSNYVNAANSYGDKTTIEDDVNEYIKENIIPRFIIDDILVYGLPTNESETELNSVVDPVNIMEGGYLPLTNFEIRRFAEKPLNFRLIYNKKPGYNYKLRVHTKIQA